MNLFLYKQLTRYHIKIGHIGLPNDPDNEKIINMADGTREESVSLSVDPF